MATQKKHDVIQELAEMLARADLAIVTDYRGLKVADLRRLRQELRPAGVEYHIAKNTLLRLAADQTGKGALKPVLEGPTAVAFITGDDFAGPVRQLGDFARTSRILQIRGGLLGNQLMTAEQITSLATMPGKQELRGQLVGQIQSPLTGLAFTLSHPLSALARVLQARADQLGGGEAAA